MASGKKFYKRPKFMTLIIALLIAAVAVPKTIALTERRAKKLDVQVEGERAWGQAVEGLAVRLRAKGETTAKRVTLLVDARNDGPGTYRGTRSTHGCWLKVDGKWYGRISSHEIVLSMLLKPGDRKLALTRLHLSAEKSPLWRGGFITRNGQVPSLGAREIHQSEPLELSPGRHTVRLAFPASRKVYAYSNAVEIEILPAEEKPAVQVEMGALSFCSVVECVLSEQSMHYSIDLDTGKTVEQAAKPGRTGLEGMDAHVVIKDDKRGLQFHEVFAGYQRGIAAEKTWEEKTAQELSKSLHDATWGKMRMPIRDHFPWEEMSQRYLTAEDELPMTLVFMTRHGTKGLLQLIEFTNNPKGVKIRYKLIKQIDNDRKPAVQVEAEEIEKTDSLVWGKEVNGLRAAVEFVPEKESYEQGEVVGIRFHLQNVSNQIINLATPRWWIRSGCFAEDQLGIKIPARTVPEPWGMTTIDRHKLLPGRVIKLESGSLAIAKDKTQRNSLCKYPVRYVVTLKPGQYSLYYWLRFPGIKRLDGDGKVIVPQPDDWQGALETGKRKLVITSNAESDQKPTVQVEAEEAWGEAVEGVQCRLRAENATWQTGEWPRFRADLRNHAERKLYRSGAPEYWEIELDGVWYHPTVTYVGTVGMWSLFPGEGQTNILVPVQKHLKWQSKKGKQPLEFRVGKHTVRFALQLSYTDGGRSLLSVVSNPVEIEILPEQNPDVQVEVKRSPDEGHVIWGEIVDGLQVGISLKRKVYYLNVNDPEPVHWQIKNTSQEDKAILWQETDYSPVFFEIGKTDEKKHLTDGRLFNWGYPKQPEKILLRPGEVKKATFDLRFFRLWYGTDPKTYEITGLYSPRDRHNLRLWLEDKQQEYKDVVMSRISSGPVQIITMRDVLTNPDVQVEAEETAQETNLVWGKEVNGLRAAVEFVPEKESYSLGERVGIRFHIQNVSKHDIQIASSGWRQEHRIFVQDDEGKEISVRSGWFTGDGGIVRYILKPLETVVLKSSGLGFGDAASKMDINTKPFTSNFIRCGPGRHFVHYKLKLPDIIRKDGDGKVIVPQPDDWQGALETGKRKLVLTSTVESDQKSTMQVEREGFSQKHEDEQDNAYLDAIIGGDLETVQELLLNDPSLISMIDNKRGKSSSGLTALQLAIKYGHSGIVELLLSKGAKADEKNVWGYGSLLVAARNGRANLVKLLVEHGADVNGEKNKFRHPPLRAASNAQVAEALIANGADVNFRDERRATALHSIARNGITTIAEVLLAHGADINAKDNAGWTPLNIAAGRGQKDMVELLITKGADINAKDKRGLTPIHRAVTAEPTVPKAGRKATAELLLTRGADFTIHDVAWVGDVARVRKLLERNPSLARNEKRALFAAIREGHSTIVELLLDNGARLSTKGRFKEPPLHAAAYSGHRDMAALLLRKGADVNRKGAHGELALHWAAAKGHGEITRLLVEAGAEVNTHSDTPRADVDVLPEGDGADVIHEQLRYLADCEKQEQAMAAGSSLQIEGLRRLAFAAGDTALHSAAQWGHKEIVELLLSNGAEVNAANKWGQTPLHYAVVFRHEDVVKALLNAGANPNAGTLDGSTAHDLASKVKDTELADMLGMEHNMIDPAGETEDESKISELLTVLEGGRYADIRQGIILMVDEIGDKEPISFLYEQLKSKDRERRSNAVLALQILGETPCVEGLCHNLELIKDKLAFGQGPELVVGLTNTTNEPIDIIGYCRNPEIHSDRYPLPCAQLYISPVGSDQYRIESYGGIRARPEAIRIAPGKSWSFEFPPPKMKESAPTKNKRSPLPSLSAWPPGKYTAQLSYFIRESEIKKFGPGLVFGSEMGSLAGKKPDRIWQGVVQSKELVFEVLDDDSEQLRIRKAVDSGEGLDNVEFELKASKTKVRLSVSAKNTGEKILYLGGHYCLRGKGPMGKDKFPSSLFGSDVPMELKPGATLELGGWNLRTIGPGTYWVEYLSNFQPERVLKKSNTVTFEVTKPDVQVEIDDSKEVPADRLIVPGQGVGDYKLGMSKDEVLKSLRKTKGDSLRKAQNSISVDGVILNFIDDSVKSIDVLSPLYEFANGLGIGDSEQKIKQTFGEDFLLKETEWKDFLIYENEGLQFEIHKKNRTVMEFSVLKKISRGPRASFVKPIKSVNEYGDVRWKDLSKFDLSTRKRLIPTLTFNQKTVWPEKAKMPPGSDPNKILTDALNPGLGVRKLHQQGITGKGVNVAIIDQPVYLVHPEFAGKIVAYHDTGCETEESSMHGPLVTSLLVGTNCGTAPGARVYYAAAPSWKMDAAYYAKGLNWIIEQNKNLPASEKIRVVSVSASPNQSSWANRQMWDRACARAEADGIMVLDCTDSRLRGFIGRCWYNARVPESVAQCNPWAPPNREFRFNPNDMSILVPASPRTAAEDGAVPGYQYAGRGGLSRAIPYCAGVLAMGWQVNPELSPDQMRELLYKSAFTKKNRAKIIYPKNFIRLVRRTKAAPRTK